MKIQKKRKKKKRKADSVLQTAQGALLLLGQRVVRLAERQAEPQEILAGGERDRERERERERGIQMEGKRERGIEMEGK